MRRLVNGEPQALLIVEDDPQYLRFLSEVLSTEGYRIITATNGKEAVRLCDSEHPNAIILDLVMPEMDGIEAIQVFQSKHPEIPIIAMSGGNYGPADVYLSVSAKLGANEILKKPFDTAILISRLDTLLFVEK